MTNPNDFIESIRPAKYTDSELSILDYHDGTFRIIARLGEDSVELVLDREQRKQFEKFWRLAVTTIYNATVKKSEKMIRDTPLGDNYD
jgi:phosphoribosyl-ATP pyrophosphohydrolase